jgi:hypothetical protein
MFSFWVQIVIKKAHSTHNPTIVHEKYHYDIYFEIFPTSIEIVLLAGLFFTLLPF